MPSPIGHAAIGIAVNELTPKNKSHIDWKFYILIAFLANIPDIDIVFGLIFYGNGNFFHRGITHSLIFSIFMAILISYTSLKIGIIPKISVINSFLVIFSHVAADLLLSTSPVSLFWPLQIYHPTEFKGWLDVLDIVFLKAYKDTIIIIFSVIFIILNRWARQMFAVNWVTNKKY